VAGAARRSVSRTQFVSLASKATSRRLSGRAESRTDRSGSKQAGRLPGFGGDRFKAVSEIHDGVMINGTPLCGGAVETELLTWGPP